MNSFPSKSLAMSAKVLQTRQDLENLIDALNFSVKEIMTKIENLKSEVSIISTLKLEAKGAENFEYEVTEDRAKQVPHSGVTNVCNSCSRTCHENCGFPDSCDKWRCCVMKERGCSSRPPAAGTGFFCTVCPNKCAWSDHHNMPFKFIVEEVTVTKTYDDLKKKYQEKGTEAINKREIIKKMYEEVLGLQLDAIDTIADMHKARADLMELALKPDGLSNIQFIGQMIEAEKYTQKNGWKDRVRHVETMRSKLLLVEQAKSAADIQEKLFSDPDPDFNLEKLLSDAVDVSAVSKLDESQENMKTYSQMFESTVTNITTKLSKISFFKRAV
jgi:hypothetical protein